MTLWPRIRRIAPSILSGGISPVGFMLWFLAMQVLAMQVAIRPFKVTNCDHRNRRALLDGTDCDVSPALGQSVPSWSHGQPQPAQWVPFADRLIIAVPSG